MRYVRCLITITVTFLVLDGSEAGQPSTADWPVYLGDAQSTHFSSLTQITPRNVHRLKPAWTFRCGDARPDGRSQIQCNPLIIRGVLYGTTPQLKAFALEASTGREIWRFDPFSSRPAGNALGVNRGLVFWGDGPECRIFLTAGFHLHALDAATGALVDSFGIGGRVDLREGLGREASTLHVLANTPGAVFENLLIVGSRVSEGPGPSAPGHIRAYDTRTGTLVWSFRTIPWPGEPGYETWPPDAWKHIGGANVWTGMAVDEKRGLVFCPTGSASFDFWGGNRIGSNLYANCLLALDARTGKRVWHYQFVRHDL
ncbi:MAG: pyrroloquinoline quinone-dependent dehydrogenase, partial [Verrucomicrobia bacterium]|nr:pyrroloquinoline quinone-dependent dehydrogenase [Verrucomicrobiota bacterium]